MSERDLTEQEIDEQLEKIMESGSPNVFFAKLIYNLRYDLNELKEELKKALVKITVEEDEPEEEEYTPTSTDDLKIIDVECKRFYNDFYA